MATGGPGATVAPIITGLTIMGSPTVGSPLYAITSSVIGYPSPGQSFIWSRGGVPIPGAVTYTYTVTEADAGQEIVLTLTARNEAGVSTASAGIFIPAVAPPPVVTPPTTTPGGAGGGGGGGGGGTGTGTTGGYVEGGPINPLIEQFTGGPTGGFDVTPGGKSAADAWDYMRGLVDEAFGGISHTLEGVNASSLTAGSDAVFAEVGAEVALEVVDLPATAFAGALLLGEYIFGWLVTQVANLFPNPSILGWHPLGFINSGIKSVGKSFEHNASYFADRITPIFVTPMRQILGVFQRLANGVVAAHNKSATIVNTNIPIARHDAVVTSGQYTDGQIAAINQAASLAMSNLLSNPSEANARQLLAWAQRFGGLAWDLTGIAAAGIVAADENTTSRFKDVQSAISSSAANVAANAQAALQAFQADVVKRLGIDEASLGAITMTVTTTVPKEIADAVAQAEAKAAADTLTAINPLQLEIATLTPQLDALSAKVTADEQTIAQAKAAIATELAQQVIDEAAIKANQDVITQAQADIATNTTMISTLHQQILATGSQITQLQQQQQLNTAQLAPYEVAGATMLPTLLATISGTLNSLKTKVDTCTVDTCDPSSPTNIRNVLRDLLKLMTAAGEIGFIAEAIHDPIGTAASVAPLLEGIDRGAIDTLDALLSL
jgi:hypothetical protein